MKNEGVNKAIKESGLTENDEREVMAFAEDLQTSKGDYDSFIRHQVEKEENLANKLLGTLNPEYN